MSLSTIAARSEATLAVSPGGASATKASEICWKASAMVEVEEELKGRDACTAVSAAAVSVGAAVSAGQRPPQRNATCRPQRHAHATPTKASVCSARAASTAGDAGTYWGFIFAVSSVSSVSLVSCNQRNQPSSTLSWT